MRIPRARRNLRAVTGLSAALGFALMFASLPAAAQQWTPKQRAACEPDAMRLCNQYVPDVQRVSPAFPAARAGQRVERLAAALEGVKEPAGVGRHLFGRLVRRGIRSRTSAIRGRASRFLGARRSKSREGTPSRRRQAAT